MNEQWRHALYFIGFLATLGFGVRFFIQWLSSEKRKESFIPRSFWIISLFSSSIMMLHSFIQIQFFVCFFQGINSLIAWRNLNLMKSHPKSLKETLWILFSIVIFIVLSFFIQSWITGDYNWVQQPNGPFNKDAQAIGFWWNCFGTIGLAAFASRFWIQWWIAEKKKTSFISASFWRISLIGAIMSLVYFIHISDIVNILGYSFGMIPYLRNLMLLKKATEKKNASEQPE